MHGARLSGQVVVIGDGMTAVDAARTALRSGAETVTVVSRYSSDTMPADAREVAAAREEGVSFEFGRRGRRGGSTPRRHSTVILAAENGRRQAPLKIGGDHLHPNQYTGRTSQDGLFVAGDALGGAHSVIHAVAGGKRAALAVDAWLRGEDLAALEEGLAAYSRLPYLEQLEAGREPGQRRGAGWPSATPSGSRWGRAPSRRLAPRCRRHPSPNGWRAWTWKSRRATPWPPPRRRPSAACSASARASGDCDLQRLGVEYGITTNDLVKKGSRVRVVQPQLEHPFIRRDMERCIACGRCVRVCRDVAGPACYDFTGRGFTINVDTPYGEALQLADCISCGRCVSTCPTGALTFNERKLSSFKVDESRCILCRECVNVCPVDALEETDHFESARQDWLQLVAQGSQLAGGHRMCAGCGAPVVVRQVLMGTSDPVVVSAATGCLEVSTTIYPYTSWKGSFIHTAFENSAATLSGVETAFRALEEEGRHRRERQVHRLRRRRRHLRHRPPVAVGRHGARPQDALRLLRQRRVHEHRLPALRRHPDRAPGPPPARWATSRPASCSSARTSPSIMIAHGIPYVAQASPHDPRDLVRKAAKALSIDGPTFLNVLAPCPRGWRSDGAESIDLAREAVNTCYWPLFECEDGEYHLTYRPHHKLPLVPWLKRQGRFAHLFQASNAATLEQLEQYVDEEWGKLLRKCGEPSEADWQAHLQANGCLLR